MQFSIRRIVLSAALALGLTPLGLARMPAAYAATLPVTNKNDSGAGSLRATIASAAAGDTINFAATVTGTIMLTSGELAINKNLTISGPGATSLTITSNYASRVFHINSGTVTISGLTLTKGKDENGGGIYNESGGTLTVSYCTLSGNVTDPYYYDDGGSEEGYGGGIYNAGTLTVKKSTFSGNSAVDSSGGGIFNAGTATVANSTFWGNHADYVNDGGYYGGGIYNGGTLTINSSTFAGNSADYRGGGLYNSGSASLTLKNSIVAGNSSYYGPDVYGACTSGGYNLIGEKDGSTGLTDGVNHDQVGSIAAPLNVKLSPLQDNGGPTLTVALLAGSPAIDAANSVTAPATDQRDFTRAGAPDSGAFEFNGGAPTGAVPFLTISDASVTEGNSGSRNATFTVRLQFAISSTVTVHYSTANGTATAGSDYTAQSGTLTFTPGQSIKTIVVPVAGDTGPEPDETFLLNLSSAVNATLADAQGVGTILHDDPFTLMVTNLNDSSAGSLRAAVNQATSGDTISFAAGLNGTISLTTGQLWIKASVTIIGPGADVLTVSGAGHRVFLFSGGHSSLSGLTIANGYVYGDSGAGVANWGTLTISNCTLSGNVAQDAEDTSDYPSIQYYGGRGGGIFNSGTLTVGKCTLANNSSNAYYDDHNGDYGDGGGIFNSGTLKITNCTLSGNQGLGAGCGGIMNDDSAANLVLLNSTISGNTGHASDGNATAVGVTSFDAGPITARNSIISGNVAVDGEPSDCYGAYTSGGYNLIGANDSSTGFTNGVNHDQVGTVAAPLDAKLGPLQNNGGPTKTMALLAGSPAIDAANSATAPATDQRGFARAGAPDIGAFESNGIAPLSINDANVIEGNSSTTNAIFTVRLGGALSQTVTVNYATTNGTAIAGTDYVATSGTLTFSPGQTSKSIAVPIKGNALDEPNRTFKVNLSGATNAVIVDNQGIGTIINNDPTPVLSISSVTLPEGNSGTTAFVFTIKLSAASSRTASVTYKTADGSATAGSDYTAIPSTTLTFAPGETTKTVTVPVKGDALNEAPETFKIVLQSASFAAIANNKGVGTISNDDALPSLSISDAPAATEGNSGTHSALFTVTLSPVSGRTVMVHYATANGTASAGSDYTAATGTLTFLPGQTSKTVPIQVLGDMAVEPDETLKVNLSGASFAVLSDSQGIHTIVNDDSASE